MKEEKKKKWLYLGKLVRTTGKMAGDASEDFLSFQPPFFCLDCSGTGGGCVCQQCRIFNSHVCTDQAIMHSM